MDSFASALVKHMRGVDQDAEITGAELLIVAR